MTKQPDIIKSGCIAGFLGTIGDFAIHLSTFYLIGTSMTSHYISQLIFPNHNIGPIQFAFGLFTHFCAGSVVGILLAITFMLTSKESAYLKGLGLGVVFWIIHVIVIPNLVDPRPFLFRTEAEAFVDLISHIAYSIITTVYLLKVPLNTLNMVEKH